MIVVAWRLYMASTEIGRSGVRPLAYNVWPPTAIHKQVYGSILTPPLSISPRMQTPAL